MKIAVTCRHAGEGTTTVAASLAVMLAETGARITYIDCNTGKAKGRMLLNPEIQEQETVSVGGPGTATSGQLIHGRAWGIDFHGVVLDGPMDCGKAALCRKLGQYTGRGITVFDLPAGSLIAEGGCTCAPDVLVIVATPESLGSERQTLLDNRYPVHGARSVILVNKHQGDSPQWGSRTNGIAIAATIPFDPRIEAADRAAQLALEVIPDIRPLFARIAWHVQQVAGTGPVRRGGVVPDPARAAYAARA
jgi:MinD superfamily P-loop ATPase